MTTHDEIPQLDATGLREFGLVTGGIIVVLFGLLIPWLLEYRFPVWPWVIALGLATVAFFYPLGLNRIYYIWMRFGLVLGWISSRIVLSFLFFGIFTPLGWVMRRRGYDPLALTFDASSLSYRKPSRVRPIRHMEKPF